MARPKLDLPTPVMIDGQRAFYFYPGSPTTDCFRSAAGILDSSHFRERKKKCKQIGLSPPPLTEHSGSTALQREQSSRDIFFPSA